MHQPHRLIITITIPLVAFMISLSQGIENLNPNDLDKLFSDLGNESYEIRQKTQNLIIDQGKKNRDLILDESFKFYVKSKDPEVKYRLRSTMLEIIGSNLKPEGFIGIRMVDAPMRIVVMVRLKTLEPSEYLVLYPTRQHLKLDLSLEIKLLVWMEINSLTKD